MEQAVIDSDSPSILVVDDEERLADLMADMLEKEGYRVFQAFSGKQALEIIDRVEPSLIVTDFMMPRMTGLDLARSLRRREKFSDLPILLVSGGRGDVGRRNPDLFNGVLDRPFNDRDLLRKVTELLQAA